MPLRHTTPRFVSLVTAALLLTLSGACDRDAAVEGAAGQRAGAEAPAAPAAAEEAVVLDQSGTVDSAQGHYRVTFTPKPNPIPFQELFEVEVAVRDAETGALVEEARLDDLQAVMPAHGHGMKVEPEIVGQKPGVFLARGMRFHMQGEGDNGRWVFEAAVSGPQGVDVAKHEVQCCQQPTQP